jgi:hypothetical protein
MAGRHTGLLVIAGAALAMTLNPAAAEPRAVIELFTSQGCSSCPPADKLIGKLQSDGSLIALSLPVDYWDYLGWKDTLASPGHTERQYGYARKRGDRQVYTPQAVINGKIHALGSDLTAIERAIARSKSDPAVMSVPVTLTFDGDNLVVTVAASDTTILPDGAGVWICGIAKEVPVKIGRGENRGSLITYYNVARSWAKLGMWDGKARTFTIPRSALTGDGVDEAAVLVQAGALEKPGAMLGAAFAKLP